MFQDEPLSAHGYEVAPTISMDGYEFRFLSYDELEGYYYYPHSILLIGTNDKTKEIVYLFYSDDDLDYIESMEEHFLNDFGWKYMR